MSEQFHWSFRKSANCPSASINSLTQELLGDIPVCHTVLWWRTQTRRDENAVLCLADALLEDVASEQGIAKIPSQWET